MEAPPAGSSQPAPPPTKVGVAFEAVPPTLVLSAAAPAVRYHAVFHSSLEPRSHGSPSLERNEASRAADDLFAVVGERRSQGLGSSSNLFVRDAAAWNASTWNASDASHAAAWAEVWEGGIEVEGNSTIAAAVNASLYAMVSSLRSDWHLGVSPGGLTHNAYCGHSFWDGETWMLPGLVALFPPLAQSLLQYRAARLPAAQETARLLGVCGSGDSSDDDADDTEEMEPCANWPWESALLGFGVSPWGDGDRYEIHIAGDIALSLELAFRASGNDPAFFSPPENASSSSSSSSFSSTPTAATTNTTGGSRSSTSSSSSSAAPYWPVVSASAAFFAAKAVLETTSSNFTFLNVIGPDESAGVVNDSAYTNAVASRALLWAVEAAAVVGAKPGSNWSTIASRVFLPVTALPGGSGTSTSSSNTTSSSGSSGESAAVGHPEYSGYAGQDINQADVALLQYPLGWAMPDDVARADLTYYEQRSSTPDTAQFYTGDSSYSIAWLRLGGNKSAADAQFEQGLLHVDLHRRNGGNDDDDDDDYDECGGVAWASGFGVWKETLTGGNLNFLTGAGGWVQNFLFGYGGLAYTAQGTLAVSLPSLPPGGVTALVLRGLTLGLGERQVRLTLRFDDQVAEFSLSSGSSATGVACVLVDGDGTAHDLPVSLPVGQQFEFFLQEQP